MESGPGFKLGTLEFALGVSCFFRFSGEQGAWDTCPLRVLFSRKRWGKKTTFVEARVHFILKNHWHHQNKLEWNPVNTVTNRPKTFGRNNEVTVLTRVSYKKMYGHFKKVAVKTRWPYYRGGRKAGFHCTIIHIWITRTLHELRFHVPSITRMKTRGITTGWWKQLKSFEVVCNAYYHVIRDEWWVELSIQENRASCLCV